jgi:DNA-binding transcriptional LysR family regulator
VPAQFTLLALGRLDVGLGRASMAPSDVASELLRLDPLGVVAPDDHPFAALPEVPVGQLAAEPLLLAEEERAPEFNQFVIELCRSVGFTPTVYHGTVESIRAGLDLVAQDSASCACPLPARHRSSPAPYGVHWSSRHPVTRGPCCGAPAIPQNMCRR